MPFRRGNCLAVFQNFSATFLKFGRFSSSFGRFSAKQSGRTEGEREREKKSCQTNRFLVRYEKQAHIQTK